jgi:acetyl-CoA acetyltransferase
VSAERPQITGIFAAAPTPGAASSLEMLIFRAVSGALEDAGITRGDLDGIVISASDQVDGRAISSMLTSGPAGAYLMDEINVASSPGHAFALACAQVMSGTHNRVVVASWGKASETAAPTTLATEWLASEPFYERDVHLTPLSAAAMQAGVHRAGRADAELAAHRVAARSRGVTPEAVEQSSPLAFPLRSLEWPEEIDGAYALIVESVGRSETRPVAVEAVSWCADSGRLADRDLVSMPHLRLATADARRRAGYEASGPAPDVWYLHDYTPDAELLEYEAVGLCAEGEAIALALGDSTHLSGDRPVNPEGGTLAGEAPFGGVLQKLVRAARQLRDEAGPAQVKGAERCFVQMSTGAAGQFQTVALLAREDAP